METKLSKLITAAQAGDWAGALRIAARFPQLGAERGVILDAHMAFTNPRFLVQIKRDPEEAIQAGIAALRCKYRI